MKIPKVNHLRFFVLDLIARNPSPGALIRKRLSKEGWNRSLPAFYILMRRLELAGLICTQFGHGHLTRRLIYSITPKGLSVHAEIVAFYQRHLSGLMKSNLTDGVANRSRR